MKGVASMTEFKKPAISVVHLSNEDVVTESACPRICYGYACDGFYCDDCVECNGNHHCFSFTCKKHKCKEY